MSPALTGRVYAGFGGSTFSDWTAAVHALGGSATAWPFKSGLYAAHYGEPTAKYPTAVFVQLANANRVPRTGIMQTTADGQWMYVLAPPPVIADAPHVMNAVERAENAAFTKASILAGDLGLPSLASIEAALKALGAEALAVAVVGGIAWYLLKRRD